MDKGKHLLIDCRNVDRSVCMNDGLVLNAMARAAERAGATVIATNRYHFGHNSPAGFTAVILLDESHCSAHSYADLGLIAMDVFTCGTTEPLLTKSNRKRPWDPSSTTAIRGWTTCTPRRQSFTPGSSWIR